MINIEVPEINQNTIGIPIQIVSDEDLSAATELKFIFRKPDESTTTEKIAQLYAGDGTNKTAEWVITSGFHDQTGEWKVILKATFSASVIKYSKKAARYVVNDNFTS